MSSSMDPPEAAVDSFLVELEAMETTVMQLLAITSDTCRALKRLPHHSARDGDVKEEGEQEEEPHGQPLPQEQRQPQAVGEKLETLATNYFETVQGLHAALSAKASVVQPYRRFADSAVFLQQIWELNEAEKAARTQQQQQRDQLDADR